MARGGERLSTTTGAAAGPVGPAAVVPVPPQVGCGPGDGDDVADARGDVLVAAGADVVLPSLVRLDAVDLQLGVVPAHGVPDGRPHPAHPAKAQITRPQHTSSAAATIT